MPGAQYNGGSLRCCFVQGSPCASGSPSRAGKGDIQRWYFKGTLPAAGLLIVYLMAMQV
jgi:hypothetical protein